VPRAPSRPPLLLLPPSEGKAEGGRAPGRPDSFADELAAPRAQVVAELARVVRRGDARTRAAVLGVRGDLLERALAATDALADGAAPVLPAWRRYAGVVWAGLEPSTLRPTDRRRILVPSALYGLTTAADPVADYRLKLLVSLGRLGRLSTWWRPVLTPALVDRVRGRVVVDLLPAEHAHALDLGAVGRVARVVRVRFVDAGGARAVGHEAKSAKGHLARAVLESGLDALVGFHHEGWRAGIDGDDVTVTAPGG